MPTDRSFCSYDKIVMELLIDGRGNYHHYVIKGVLNTNRHLQGYVALFPNFEDDTSVAWQFTPELKKRVLGTLIDPDMHTHQAKLTATWQSMGEERMARTFFARKRALAQRSRPTIVVTFSEQILGGAAFKSMEALVTAGIPLSLALEDLKIHLRKD